MIFKVLAPPASGASPTPPAMAYDQRRTIMLTVPMTEALRAMLGGKVRIFVEGRAEKGEFLIDSVVPDRGW